MTGESDANDPPRTPHDEERDPGNDWWSDLAEPERRAVLTWVGENLPEVRRSAYGQRSVYWALGVSLVVGLVAYTGGYALKTSTTTEPLGFVGDLLYTLGWALWTGVVVAVYLQVIPQVKQRGYKRLLADYEAARRDDARAEIAQASWPGTARPS
jgi:hypothetical protein